VNNAPLITQASQEYEDPAQGGRGDAGLSPQGYVLPRVKIAVGSTSQDLGDAVPDRALPVESRAERQMLELARIQQMSAQMNALRFRVGERVELVDSRGYDMSSRGVR
jgi:hypothetical protein